MPLGTWDFDFLEASSWQSVPSSQLVDSEAEDSDNDPLPTPVPHRAVLFRQRRSTSSDRLPGIRILRPPRVKMVLLRYRLGLR